MSGRITSFHVAALAGVSQPTVSRALREQSNVSSDTRTRVLEAAHKLGYRLDRRAASLRGGSTKRIAVVILSAPGERDVSPNPLYMALLGHVAGAASRRGYEILVSFQRDADSFYAGHQRNGEADGLIIMGSAQNLAGWLFYTNAHASGANIVGWGSPVDTVPTIRCDNRGSAALAVDHLSHQGRRHIAFIGPGWRRHHAYRERRIGYVQAMRAAGLRAIEAPVVPSGAREDVGFAATLKLIEATPEVDAIFAACDLLAMGVVRALIDRGRLIPQDVAVSGFDGIRATSQMCPGLTTIEQDAAVAGEQLVKALLGEAPHPDGASGTVPTRLVVREST